MAVSTTIVAVMALIASTLIAGLLVQSIRRRHEEGARLKLGAHQRHSSRHPRSDVRDRPDGTYLDYYARDLADLYVPPELFSAAKSAT
jgi:hypothetical protein